MIELFVIANSISNLSWFDICSISFIAKIDKFDRKERYSKSKKIVDQYLIDRSNLNLKVFLD